MDRHALLSSVSESFRQQFQSEPQAVVSAPGRVNLLGEHTDYNGGFVLPMPLDLEIAVAIGEGSMPGSAHIYSQNFDAKAEILLSDGKSDEWTDYILGCFHLSQHKPDLTKGYAIAVASTLPMGAGISSSAALEVATLRAIAAFRDVEPDHVAIARIAQKVEKDFVGMPCGIMDQFVSSVGTQDMALFLDTQSLHYELAPLFPEARVVVIHSGVTHKLTDGGYKQRVKECQSACEKLGVTLLREVDMADLERIEAMGGVETQRARHIVTENRRVLDGVVALKAHDMENFGRLMTESHISQRDDYNIVVEETDQLVMAALDKGALGARQTGGGFGGSIIALVRNDKVDAFCEAMVRDFDGIRILAVT